MAFIVLMLGWDGRIRGLATLAHYAGRRLGKSQTSLGFSLVSYGVRTYGSHPAAPNKSHQIKTLRVFL